MEILGKPGGKTLYQFGCSFSAAHSTEIRTEDTYGYLLARDLNLNYKTYAVSGYSNEMSLLNLIESLHSLKRGDIVIFQFTSYLRQSYVRTLDKSFDGLDWWSTAGIWGNRKQLRDHIDYAIKDFNRIVQNKEDEIDENLVDILVKYKTLWHRRTTKILDRKINSLLTYINNLGIDVHTLYMSSSDFDIVEPSQFAIELFNPEDKYKKYSMRQFNIYRKLTLSDTDMHPSKKAHEEYAKIIKQYIHKNKLI